jgi:hypothetical protein
MLLRVVKSVSMPLLVLRLVLEIAAAVAELWGCIKLACMVVAS